MSTACVEAGERADCNYSGTFPHHKHAASVVTTRLWKLCSVYYLHRVTHMKAKARGDLGILTIFY